MCISWNLFWYQVAANLQYIWVLWLLESMRILWISAHFAHSYYNLRTFHQHIYEETMLLPFWTQLSPLPTSYKTTTCKTPIHVIPLCIYNYNVSGSLNCRNWRWHHNYVFPFGNTANITDTNPHFHSLSPASAFPAMNWCGSQTCHLQEDMYFNSSFC